MTERDDTDRLRAASHGAGRRTATDVDDGQAEPDDHAQDQVREQPSSYSGPPPVERPAADSMSTSSTASATTGVPSGETPAVTGGATAALRRARGPRRARLQLRHVDPWSMLKFSLVLAVALFVVWMVAVGVLYGVLDRLDVFDKVNDTINEINGTDDEMVTPQIVLAAAAVIGAINIVLFTALATIGSFIYNLCADMVGGLEVTLSERD